jgi:hypothetical protein
VPGYRLRSANCHFRVFAIRFAVRIRPHDIISIRRDGGQGGLLTPNASGQLGRAHLHGRTRHFAGICTTSSRPLHYYRRCHRAPSKCRGTATLRRSLAFAVSIVSFAATIHSWDFRRGLGYLVWFTFPFVHYLFHFTLILTLVPLLGNSFGTSNVFSVSYFTTTLCFLPL